MSFRTSWAGRKISVWVSTFLFDWGNPFWVGVKRNPKGNAPFGFSPI